MKACLALLLLLPGNMRTPSCELLRLFRDISYASLKRCGLKQLTTMPITRKRSSATCRHIPETLDEPRQACLLVWAIPSTTGHAAAMQAFCTCAPLLASCLPPDRNAHNKQGQDHPGPLTLRSECHIPAWHLNCAVRMDLPSFSLRTSNEMYSCLMQS